MTDRTRRRGEKFPMPDPEALLNAYAIGLMDRLVRRGMRGPLAGQLLSGAKLAISGLLPMRCAKQDPPGWRQRLFERLIG